jgi:cell division septum initiation protein DivIVA
VPRFPSFLDRFRRLLAPPGRPSEVLGVPASGDELELELRPLLGQLETVEGEAARIAEEAGERAERVREEARRKAEAILEEARERADAERARAAVDHHRVGRQNGEAARARARGEAELIQAQSEERIADLVAEVLECVWRSGR